MNPDPIQQTEDRLAFKSRMVTKFHRYSALVIRKWWVAAVCVALGMAWPQRSTIVRCVDSS